MKQKMVKLLFIQRLLLTLQLKLPELLLVALLGGNDAKAETPVLWPPHAKS